MKGVEVIQLNGTYVDQIPVQPKGSENEVVVIMGKGNSKEATK
jgi:hypothetical protein